MRSWLKLTFSMFVWKVTLNGFQLIFCPLISQVKILPLLPMILKDKTLKRGLPPAVSLSKQHSGNLWQIFACLLYMIAHAQYRKTVQKRLVERDNNYTSLHLRKCAFKHHHRDSADSFMYLMTGVCLCFSCQYLFMVSVCGSDTEDVDWLHVHWSNLVLLTELCISRCQV